LASDALLSTLRGAARRVLLFRLTGLTRWRSRQKELCRLGGILVAGPVALNLVLVLLGAPGRVSGIAWAWLAYFGGLATLIFVASATGWSRLEEAADSINDLIVDVGARRRIESLFVWYLRYPVQISALVLGALTWAIFLWASQPYLGQRLQLGIASFLAVSIAGAATAGGTYWALVLIIMARRIQAARDLRIRWLDPSRTEGIAQLSGGYSYGLPWAVAALAATEVPVVYARSLAPESTALLVANIVAPLLAVSATLGWSILPHLWLTKIIAREKRTILSGLAEYIAPGSEVDYRADAWPHDTALAQQLAEKPQDELVALYAAVASSPQSSFPTSGVVQYTAALGTLLLPFLAERILALLAA